jgi:hypothetical protein
MPKQPNLSAFKGKFMAAFEYALKTFHGFEVFSLLVGLYLCL